MDIEKLFEKSPLVPAIIQEADTGEVLMLAYMNEESLKKTLESGYTWFFSRSRGRLWQRAKRAATSRKWSASTLTAIAMPSRKSEAGGGSMPHRQPHLLFQRSEV